MSRAGQSTLAAATALTTLLASSFIFRIGDMVQMAKTVSFVHI